MNRHPDAYQSATLLVAALCYELPATRTLAQWVDVCASYYGLFRSRCIAGQVGADVLPGLIRKQARVLLGDVLKLDSHEPVRHIGRLAVIENGLALLVDACQPVHIALMEYQMLLIKTIARSTDPEWLGDFDFEPSTGVIEGAYYHQLNQQ